MVLFLAAPIGIAGTLIGTPFLPQRNGATSSRPGGQHTGVRSIPASRDAPPSVGRAVLNVHPEVPNFFFFCLEGQSGVSAVPSPGSASGKGVYSLLHVVSEEQEDTVMRDE